MNIWYRQERLGLETIGHPLLCSAALWTVRRRIPIERHVPGFYEINYLHRGNNGWTLDDGSRRRVYGGDISLIQPNTGHATLNDAFAPSECLALGVRPTPSFPCHPFLTPKEPDRRAPEEPAHSAGSTDQ